MIFSLVKRQKLSILFDFVFFVILEAWHNKYLIFKQEFKNILSTWQKAERARYRIDKTLKII